MAENSVEKVAPKAELSEGTVFEKTKIRLGFLSRLRNLLKRSSNEDKTQQDLKTLRMDIGVEKVDSKPKENKPDDRSSDVLTSVKDKAAVPSEEYQKTEILEMNNQELKKYVLSTLMELESTLVKSNNNPVILELKDVNQLLSGELSHSDLEETLELSMAALTLLSAKDLKVRLSRFAINTLKKKLRQSDHAAGTEAAEKDNSRFGDKSIEDTDLRINVNDLPWITRGKETVPLKLVKIKGTGIEYYLADTTNLNKNLGAAFQKLQKDQVESADKLFFANVQKWLDNRARSGLRYLTDTRGNRKIVKIDPPSGIRIHFLEHNRVGDKPVIVRVATYDKIDQTAVLGELTSNSAKKLVYLGKL